MTLPKPIRELIRDFLADKDVRRNTRANYRRTLDIFVNWLVFNNIPIAAIQRADIINYKAYLIEAKHRPTTVDSYLTSVRQLFAWMDENGIYKNVAVGVKSPWKHRGFCKNHLSCDDVEKLISVINPDTIIGKRDRAIVSLMVTMGPRACEVCRLERDDVLRNSAGMKLAIIGKRHYDKRIIGTVPAGVVTLINNYQHCRVDDHDSLFATHKTGQQAGRMSSDVLSRIIRQYLIAAQLKTPKVSAHSLRHTAAVTALQNGATIEEVMAMLGHKDISTTQIYISSIRANEAANSTAVRCAAAALNMSV